MKYLRIIFIFFSLLPIYSENFIASFPEDFIGSWLPYIEEQSYTLKYESFSWGFDKYSSDFGIVIDWQKKDDNNQQILFYCGMPYLVKNVEKIDNTTYYVHLANPNNFSRDMNSIVVFHKESQNEIWIERYDHYYQRTGINNYPEYVFSDYDLNFQLKRISSNNYLHFFRHSIEIDMETVVALANNNYIRLRSEPNLNGEGMGFIQEGDSVQILEISDHMEKIGGNIDNWYKVKTSDGTEAWTFGAFLNFPKSAYVWYDGGNEEK